MPVFPFTAFTELERRIIAEALAGHVAALQALLEGDQTINGYGEDDLRSDATIARYLLAQFTAA